MKILLLVAWSTLGQASPNLPMQIYEGPGGATIYEMPGHTEIFRPGKLPQTITPLFQQPPSVPKRRSPYYQYFLED